MPQKIEWTRELVGKFWDGFSQTRLEELSFGRSAGPKLLEFIGHHLTPGLKCLDYGAGEGSLVSLLLDKGCQVAAWEPSPERRAEIIARGVENNERFLGFIDSAGAEVFDVVIASEVIEHILENDLDDVLAEFRRFLRPGGLLIITTPNNEDLELGSCYCPVSDTVFHRWQHVRSFTAESLDDLLSGAGFRRIEDHRVDFSTFGEFYENYVSITHDMKYLKLMGPLYYLVKPWLKTKPKGDLRVGAQNNLIYVGQAE